MTRTYSDENMLQRIDYIDHAKAIGIFLVVLAHTPIESEITNWIYVFHMPLFFFLSGFIFDFQRYPSLSGFIRRRFRQLLIPYFLINLLTYLLWLFVFRHYGADSDIEIAWYQPLIGFMLGNGNQMIHNVPLWFLLCLFIVEVVFYFAFQKSNLKKVFLGTALFAVIGYLNYTINPYLLPFSLGSAFVGLSFYGIGYICAHTHLLKTQIIWCILSFIITVVIAYYNGRINMHINYYGHYLLFLIGALTGIYMVICFSNYFVSFGNTSLVSFIGKNTLLICGFHLMTFSLIKGVLVFVFHFNMQLLEQQIIGNLLFAILSILLCCVLISTYHKGKILINNMRDK